jgi:hypothetical protein
MISRPQVASDGGTINVPMMNVTINLAAGKCTAILYKILVYILRHNLICSGEEAHVKKSQCVVYFLSFFKSLYSPVNVA